MECKRVDGNIVFTIGEDELVETGSGIPVGMGFRVYDREKFMNGFVDRWNGMSDSSEYEVIRVFIQQIMDDCIESDAGIEPVKDDE